MSISGIQFERARVRESEGAPVLRPTRAERGDRLEESGAEAQDRVSFSAEALAHSRGVEDAQEEEQVSEDGSHATSVELDEAERHQVEKLHARDAEVREHEAAHMAAGGAHVSGGATYTFQLGPDGKSYATGGEVGIDVSPVSGNPQATIQKMQQIRAAALAPGDPSGADRAVAARASQAEAQAREALSTANLARVSETYGQGDATVPKTGSLVDAQA